MVMANKIGKPNLEFFAQTLLEQAKLNKDILVVTSDSEGSESWSHLEKSFQIKLLKLV